MRSFWRHAAAIAPALRSGRLLVTLDFDGTLAALAETPGDAKLTPEFRLALRRLAGSEGVAVFILSGRALADVRRLVGLKNLYYGGNHGMEMAGPGFRWKDKDADAVKPLLSAIAAGLAARFPSGTGVLIENKDLSASVHYRSLKPAYRKSFFAHMRALASATDRRLRWSRGHKVYELRPAAAPHKGDALLRIRERLRPAETLAVGDDLTDEDMFRALRGRGVSLRVGRKRTSSAGYWLGRQEEVLELIRFVTGCRRQG